MYKYLNVLSTLYASRERIQWGFQDDLMSKTNRALHMRPVSLSVRLVLESEHRKTLEEFKTRLILSVLVLSLCRYYLFHDKSSETTIIWRVIVVLSILFEVLKFYFLQQIFSKLYITVIFCISLKDLSFETEGSLVSSLFAFNGPSSAHLWLQLLLQHKYISSCLLYHSVHFFGSHHHSFVSNCIFTGYA